MATTIMIASPRKKSKYSILSQDSTLDKMLILRMSIFGSFAIGRLVEDPQLRQATIAGTEIPVCEFCLAVNYGFGENEKTEFVNCVAWRKLAEIIGSHCKKGRKIFVSGHQQTRHYDTEKEGVTFRVYKTEWIVDEFEFCDSVPGKAASEEETATPAQAPTKKKTPF